MDATTPHDAEESGAPRDLRAELFQALSTRFAEALESNGALPAAVQDALVQLLDSESPTATEVLAAVLKTDSEEEDVADE
jgi:hypothetical protein